MTSITDMLEQMRAAGMPYEQGTPATGPEVAALQAASGNRFPSDYVAFLQAFGWLRAGRCVVFGPGSHDAGIDSAAVDVEQEFALWEETVVDVTPLLAQANLFPQQCLAVDASGQLQSFRRGRLKAFDGSFEEEVLASLAKELERHLGGLREKALRDQVMTSLCDRIPGELQAGEGLDDGRVVLRRPGDGSLIEIRFGTGLEYGANAPGVFVHWTQPSSKSPEAMNAFNHGACLVRGSIQDGCDRYRACLPADVSSAQALLAALRDDAGLPITVDVSAGPTLDQIAAALPPSPVVPEKMLLAAILGQDAEPPAFEREGDRLLLAVAGLADDEVKHAVRIRAAGHGLVEVSHVLSNPLAWPQINALNGASSRGTPERDDETTIRAVADGAATVLSFRTTLAGLASGAYRYELTRLLNLADEGLSPQS